ncbi:GAK9 protein, partial [Eudromia elegans]|nr:GAK9 protein [Eudromia elegans]
PACRPKIYPPRPSIVHWGRPESVPLPSDDGCSADSEDECPPMGEGPMETGVAQGKDLKERQQQMEKLMQQMEDSVTRLLGAIEIQQRAETVNAPQIPTQQAKTVQQLQDMLHTEPTAPPSETMLIPPPYSGPNCLTVEEEMRKQRTHQRWSGIIRDAIIEGDWQAAEAMVCPILYDQSNPRYEQHDWKILQQARKTVTEHGIKSEAARAILDWIFTADVNSPNDSKNLARLLLSPSQLMVWEKEWGRLAALEAGRPRDQNDVVLGINPDMLTGTGVYSHMPVQINYPLAIHHLSAQLARQAFNAVPDSKPQPPFTTVRQGLTEPYSHFIDRLWASLESQNEMSVEAKQHMFKLLAFENANAKMKPILATLPKHADVGDMLDIAMRANQSLQGQLVANAVAEAIKPTTNLLAAAVNKLGSGYRPDTTTPGICYR